MAEMMRDLAHAKREDKRMTPESRNALLRMFDGDSREGTVSAVDRNVDQSYHQANTKWMTIARAKYQGAVIRRTVNSLDYEGNPISGLEPYEEHICMLNLFNHEYDALEMLAENAVSTVSFGRCFSSEVRNCIALTMQSW